jgi:hypothetical protein
MSLDSSLTIQGYYRAAAAAGTAGSAVETYGAQFAVATVDGTVAGAADRAWSHANDAATTTAEVFDLTALVGPEGADRSMPGGVRWLLLANTHATASLVVGPDVTDGWTAAFPAARTLAPGEVVLIGGPSTGMAVDSTHRRLSVAAAAGTCSYRLAIVGLSA